MGNNTKTIILSLLALFITPMLRADSGALKCAGCKTEFFLMQDIAKTYTGDKVQPAGTGNKKALSLLAEGKLDFAFTCKPHFKVLAKMKKEAESAGKEFSISPDVTKSWVSLAFAKDPVVIVINKDAGVSNLTIEQIKDVFTGKVTNWKDVGGADLPIKLAIFDSKVDSGTATVFWETVAGKAPETTAAKVQLDSPNKLGNFCSSNSGAVTFMAFRSYKESYGNVVNVGDASPSKENIIAGKYPLVATYHLVYNTSKQETVQSLLDYLKSDQGRSVIDSTMISIDQKEIKKK